jgi:hypothetical protein
VRTAVSSTVWRKHKGAEAAAFKAVNIVDFEKYDVHAKLDDIVVIIKLLRFVERPMLIQADNKRAR